MRTCLIVGFSSVVAGSPLFAAVIQQFVSQDWHMLHFWTWIILFLPLLINSAFAVYLYRMREDSFLLMVIPAFVFLPILCGIRGTLTFPLYAGLIWISGRLTFFLTRRFDPSTSR